MNRQEIKTLAKKRFAENRWPMVLVALISSVLSGLVTFNSGAQVNLSYDVNGVSSGMNYTQQNPVINIIAWLLGILVVNVISIGVAKFFRENIRQNKEVEVILDGFKNNYLNNVLTMFVSGIFVALGIVCLIVPGIIVALGLALVPYILAAKPELGMMDTFKLSWELMKGHKWEYFVLCLSFIGWLILDVLTLGILGIFYVHPYLNQTQAVFCDRLLEGNL